MRPIHRPWSTIRKTICNAALLTLVACMLPACTTHQAPVPPPPNEVNWDLQKLLEVAAVHEWSLTTFVSNGTSYSPLPNAKATLSIPHIGKVAGTASVNRYSGEFNLYTGDRIAWTGAGFATTRMIGPDDFAEQERRFLTTLRLTDRVVVTRSSITFSDENGSNRMTFTRIRE